MACVKCNTGILCSDEQYYFVADMGPELLFIIQQQLTTKIADDAILCGTCYNHAMNVFTNSCNSSEINQDTTIQPISETVEKNECVWCLLTLSGRRTHSLPIGPQRNLISTRIAPRQIRDEGLVCYRCWVQASRLMNASTSTTSTQEQSPNICVWCKRSLAVRRAHTIPYGPERDIIAAGIAPRQILPGDKVCYSCWVSAQRTVHRANNPEQYNRNGCIVCSTSTVRRQTHLLPNGPVRDVISRRIYPRQITNQALVCNECWTWTQTTVQQEINDPIQPESDQERPLQVLDESGRHRQYFRPGDIFILDRGFRDALPLLESIYKVCKPESLEEGETQLSTIKANKSRLVTLCRWVVEVVNGRFAI